MANYEGETEQVKDAKLVKLAPVDMQLNVDIAFLKLIKKRLIKRKEVLITGKTVILGRPEYGFIFDVLETDPLGEVKVTEETFLDFQGKRYRTCTFRGLGLKKEYFLKRLIRALETEGFKLSEGPEWLRNYFLGNTKIKDVILVSDKESEIFLRAEERKDYLKFGYISSWEPVKLKSRFTLGFISWFFLVLFGIVFLEIYFLETLKSSLETTILLLLPLVFLAVIPLVLHLVIKSRRVKRKIEDAAIESARAMGVKEIIQFKNDFMD